MGKKQNMNLKQLTKLWKGSDKITKLFCLLGASGVGKTTVGNYMRDELDFEEVISHTTRDPREGEKHGVTYYYVDNQEFGKLNKVEEVQYSGNKYAFTKGEIDDKLNNYDKVFLIADRNGIKQLKDIYGDAVIVVFLYSTPLECFKRLYQRDGFWNAVERVSRAIIKGEFNNQDIADYIIRSEDGKLDKLKREITNICDLEERLTRFL